MQKTLKNNLRIGLGLSLIILFISSLASYMSIQNLIKSSGMVSHSNLVMSNLDGIISTLKDAETGQRGYLLTGEDLFLQPYAGAKDEAVRLLNIVEQETKDNPVQQSSVKKLRTIIQDRLGVLDRTIQIKKAGGSVSVGDLLTGKEYMDNARTVIKTMQTDENNLLISRTSDQNKLAGYTPMLIILAAAFAIFILQFLLQYYPRIKIG